MSIEKHVTSRELSEALKDAGAEQLGGREQIKVFWWVLVWEQWRLDLAESKQWGNHYRCRAFLLSELLEMGRDLRDDESDVGHFLGRALFEYPHLAPIEAAANLLIELLNKS